MSATKHCPDCKTTLPLSEFYTVKRPSGLRTSGYCRTCTKARAVAWMKAQSPEWHAAKAKRDAARRVSTEERRVANNKAGAARAAAFRAAHPEKAAEYHRASRKRSQAADPERHRMRVQCSNNHNRAKMKGVSSGFGVHDWDDALEAFNHSCAYCGAPNCVLDLDHFVSMNHGGGNVPGNVVPACRPCNAQKATRTVEEFAAVSRIPPERVAWIREVLAYLAAQREVA